MSIKEIYKTLLIDRYNNKKYYNPAIEFDYSTNVLRIAHPNCSTRLVLKPTYDNGNLNKATKLATTDKEELTLANLEYALSGDMFAFVVTELLIDYLLTHTKEESKQYLSNLSNRLNTNTEVDSILISNYQSPSINKILGYFTSFINTYAT